MHGMAQPSKALPFTQDITKNYSRDEAAEQVQDLLPLPWTSASLITSDGSSISVQITKKGRALVQRTPLSTAAAPQAPVERSGSSSSSSSGGGAGGAAGAGSVQRPQPALQHDRRKALLILGDVPDPFLQKIGIQTEDGRVRANMQVGVLG